MNASRDMAAIVVGRAAQECKSRHRVALDGSLASQVAGKLNGVHHIVKDPNETADVAFVDVHTLGSDGAVAVDNSLPHAAYLIGLSDAGIETLSELFTKNSPDGRHLDRLICASAVIDFTGDGVVLREVANHVSGKDVQAAVATRIWASHDLKLLGA